MVIDFLMISLDGIPHFNVREPPMTPGNSSKIDGISVDELRRAYTYLKFLVGS
jgi:hypothetical protein